MYDYINGKQVKCFYTPLFYVDDLEPNKYIYHSGGSLTGFNNRDLVPTETMYYKYPKDFIIYDFRNDDFVHVIKDNKVYDTIKINSLTKEYFNLKFIDYFGRTLNIKNFKDMKLIQEDFNKLFNSKKDLIKNIKENQNKKNKLLEKADNLNKEFNNKWFIYEFSLEKYLGELSECYLWLKENNDKDINLCKSLLKDLFLTHKDIINKYSNWIKNDDYVLKIENIKKEVL